MKVKLFGIVISVSFPAVAFLSIAILCDKKGAVPLCFISSLLHEIGHIIAMIVKGAEFKSIKFGLGDVSINADSQKLSYSDEIFITISGVAVNFILSLLMFAVWSIFKLSIFYDLSVVNLLLAFFNLLPVRFLDGGQLLLYALKKRLAPTACDKIVDILTLVFVIPIGVLGFIFLFNSTYNFSLLFAALYLICTLVSKEFKNVS